MLSHFYYFIYLRRQKKMKRKIIGIFICTLMIATAVLAIGTTNAIPTKTTNTITMAGNEKRSGILGSGGNNPVLGITWWDSDWAWSGKLMYPYQNNGMIILFGNATWNPSYGNIKIPRIQANADGGARILGTQGNTPDQPAIGFFSTDGVNDGGGGTGMYRPLANTIAFSTGSIERMRIGPSNIGINLPHASSTLHVNGSIATAVAHIAGGSSAFYPYDIVKSNSIIVVNAPYTGGWLRLPLAADCSGREYTIKRIDYNGSVWVETSGADYIDWRAASTIPYFYELNHAWACVVVVSDGISTWYIVSEV
jgi:hypothetical protein